MPVLHATANHRVIQALALLGYKSIFKINICVVQILIRCYTNLMFFTVC